MPHDIEDDPVLQVLSQEGSTSSKFDNHKQRNLKHKKVPQLHFFLNKKIQLTKVL